ncbi:T9SS type A sorting domain-containing protein [uncultured Polaribacter sp.]|uniref:T9SS type A sorting domain-containing protein n=1 Tax=uncultured Polaribacter sp. TaxID=174711 RepID=UPI00261244CF|nr:T9SS type A sorting domain-containing protein [uncultured Polaribacter sp.]
MKKILLILLVTAFGSSVTYAQTVWSGAVSSEFANNDNWSLGYPGQAAFGNQQAIIEGNSDGSLPDCIITTAADAKWFEFGNGGIFGSIIVKDNASLTSTDSGHWSAIGWTGKARLLVEAGGTVTTGSHLWLAFNPGAQSTIDLYGTLNVGAMFGINFESKADATSSASVTIYNGGILNLSQLAFTANPDNGTQSFNGTVSDESVKVMGGGKITLGGDQVDNFKTLANNEKIIAPGGSIEVNYDATTDLTTVTSNAPLSVKDFATLDFELFPNPSSNFLQITSKTTISNVKIYNSLGKMVSDTKEAKVDISGLSRGFYIVKVKDNVGNLGLRKLIKE